MMLVSECETNLPDSLAKFLLNPFKIFPLPLLTIFKFNTAMHILFFLSSISFQAAIGEYLYLKEMRRDKALFQ
jgi:hypothetical protein